MTMLLESDEEVLCDDVHIGRMGRTYLSLHVAFYHRDTTEWGEGRVVHAARHDFGVNGVFLELGVQGIIRRYVRKRRPSLYWPGMAWWGTPRWDVSRMILARGVEMNDILTLRDLTLRYHKGVQVIPDTPQVRALFLPREDERTIRDIAARLSITAENR